MPFKRMNSFLVMYLILLTAGIYTVVSVEINGFLRVAVIFILFSYLVIVISAWFLAIGIHRRKKLYIEPQKETILIVAPHQDDGVAMAGGYAAATAAGGGSVHVLYTTDGYENDKVTRKQEAENAWSLIDGSSVTLTFLKHHNLSAFLKMDEVLACIEEIDAYIQHCKPDKIFLPLYEGGHFQHDVTNYMVSEAVKKSDHSAELYEAPLYNFYLSVKITPEKVVSALFRFIPWMNYLYSPEPVKNDSLYYLLMNDQSLLLKKKMIAEFKTQSPHKLISRFGFADRYQKMHDYDYSKSPFVYGNSLASYFDKMKEWPVLGAVARKMMIWTRTIHLDPGYKMTRIDELLQQNY